jgi:TatD DNase family protein
VFDAHAHLQALPPDPQPDGVAGWVVPGVDLASETLAATLAQDARIVAAIGLHPWHVPATVDELAPQLAALEAAIDARRPAAIGETGLDKGWRGGPKEVQRAAFVAQVQLAGRLGLPLILHCVRSHGGCLRTLLTERFDRGGMVHDFGGPVEVVRDWVDAGFFLSISPRGMAHKAVIAAIPGERLLIETDDEGVERLPEVCRAVAEARGVTPDDVAAITACNARRLFGLDPTPPIG